MGRALYYRGHLRGAADLFESFREAHPASPYADDAAYWQARCAGDTPALLRCVSRIREEEWLDGRLARLIRRVLDDPRAVLLRDPGGEVRVGYFEADGRLTVHTPHGSLLLEAAGNGNAR